MTVPPPNASMGLLNLGGCGVLPGSLQPDSSPGHGFLVSRRNISVSPLGWGLKRRGGRAVDARTAGFGTVGALASGEAGAGSSELRCIEKELTFIPTFTDYVKIMESVKLDRSKSLQDSDAGGKSSRRRPAGDDDAPAVRGADRESGDPRNKLSEGKRGARRDSGSDEGRGVKLANSDRQKNFTGFVKKRMLVDAESSNDGKGKVEEHVRRRIVRGELSKVGDNFDNNDAKQVASDVKTNIRGSEVVHQSAGNKYAQSNARNDLQGRATSIGSRTSVPPDNSIILRDTKSMVRRGKEDFTSGISNRHERDFEYSKERKNSNSEVNADGKFQRYQRRIESSGRSVVGRFRKDAMDCEKPTVSKRYGHLQAEPEPYGHPTNSLKRGKPEVIRTRRGENVQIGKFVDANAGVFDDRAAFKTFETFTDIRNRPRVLQMEMEERIQKLASRLNATDVNTPEWKFSKIIHDAQIKFTDHSILRIVQILGRYGNWKRVLQVVEWLQSRERFKSYKSRYIYTTVLDVLGKAKRSVEALNVFYTMLDQLSTYPDMAAYHCIAVTLGQAGLVKELFDVIDCMCSPPRKKFKVGHVQNWEPRLEPDLIVYNAVLNACVQQKQWEGAFWVLQQLKEKNIRPTNTTYGLVMEVMLACSKYDLVYEFFNKVEKTSIPGALNYKVLINALWRESKIDEALMAVKNMENRGIVGSASLYYDLARCLCSGGRCKEALLQVEKICKVANKPLVVTYTGLIQSCIDSGSMENAKYIFNEMCNYCSPNNVTCNIMLKSFIEHGMFEDAKDLLWNILNGRIRSKVDSSKKSIADKFTFNTFMEACAEAKKWDDFEYAFRQMLSNGYHFDERRHLRMVLDAYRNGKEVLLEDTWNYLCDHDRVPPSAMIMERFCLKLRQGDTMAAISCISSFPESKIHDVSSMSWFNLLNRNMDNLKEESIAQLVHELNSLVNSGSYSGSLYQNILSTCTEFLSGASHAEKAPLDKQLPLCNP